MYDCIDRWTDYLGKEKGLSPNSIKAYRRHAELLSTDTGDDPRVLDTETIRAWLHERGGSVSSFGVRYSALNSFYRWLVTTKARIDNPMTGIEIPRRHKNLPRPVEDLETALAILDELDERANRNAAKMPCLKSRKVGESRAMAVFLCETGLRIHEAETLKLPVPAPATLVVRGKGGKTGKIPLTDLAREAWNFLEGGWPINARATQRRFQEAGFSPHQCRHWRGTSMADAGCDLGDIRAMLRHETMNTTLGYAQWSTERVATAVAKVPSRVAVMP